MYLNLLVISGFRREVDEICALLGYYADYSGKELPLITCIRCVISQKSTDLGIIGLIAFRDSEIACNKTE